jgi:hypothetical protein
MAPPQPLNPEPLLRALHEAGVQHIIIGGFAVNAHGVIRPSRGSRHPPGPRIMQWVPGIEADPAYLALATESLEGELDGTPLRVCGLGHLIAMKRAAGRPRDLDDLKRLGVD